MTVKTTDISDEYPDRVRILTPIFLDYGGVAAFGGPAATVKVFEDNSRVREALEEPGHGRVLVVDGGGSLRCALLGDNLAALGQRNGWAGIIVYGCIRDSDDIAGIDIGVKALNTHPRKSVKKGEGERDVPVTFAGVTVNPGEWVFADGDGILVADDKLA
ncbi:MAG: ribonuclease E activity regulator RraA [Ectothiorhodospiraceae bacterium]|jgi:regulator of ribonuclease activity A